MVPLMSASNIRNALRVLGRAVRAIRQTADPLELAKNKLSSIPTPVLPANSCANSLPLQRLANLPAYTNINDIAAALGNTDPFAIAAARARSSTNFFSRYFDHQLTCWTTLLWIICPMLIVMFLLFTVLWIRKLITTISSLKAQNAELVQKNEDLSSDVSSLKAELGANDKEKMEQRHEIQTLTDFVKILKTDVTYLRSREQEIKERAIGLVVDKETQVVHLTQQLAEHDHSIKNLEATKACLESDLKHSRNRITDMEKVLATSAENQKIKDAARAEEIRAQRIEIQTLTDFNKILKTDVTFYKSELTELLEKLACKEDPEEIRHETKSAEDVQDTRSEPLCELNLNLEATPRAGKVPSTVKEFSIRKTAVASSTHLNENTHMPGNRNTRRHRA